jgi:hypothetical protein
VSPCTTAARARHWCRNMRREKSSYPKCAQVSSSFGSQHVSTGACANTQAKPSPPPPVLVACARARVAQPVLLCGATFVRSAVTRALQPAILPIAVHGLPVDSSHSVSGGLGPANKTLLCPRGKCELLAREYSHRRRRSRYTCGGRTSVRRPTGCLLDPYATPCHASLHPPARRSVVTAAPGLRVMRR